MEMFASTVVWEGDGRITIYDKTQGPQNVRGYLSRIFGFKEADIRVLNPFVGGAFGSALRPQYQVYLAVMAAKMLQRSVRVAMTRPQMFTHSYRPPCAQNVSLGAESDGRLSAIINNAVTSTSRFENYMENVVNWNGSLYACDNASFDYRLVALDTATPGDMRAPGAATGVNLFEIAMDELAYASNVDPLELRIRNYSDKDAMSGAPYTSKALMSCYREAAIRFAWDKRSHAPRSMKEGSELIGLGMATGMWEALMVPATARVTLDADGRVEVASATSDIGTGTYTIMAQIVADTLGVPPDKITVKLGDSDLPTAPVQGGSFTAASVGAAIQLACQAIAEQLLKAASKMNGKPLGSAKIDDIAFSNGMMTDKSDSSCAVALTDVMRASGEQSFQAEKTAKPGIFSHLRKSRHTHSAVFAEVRVDEDLGVIRVPRIVCAVAAGRILNPKTARSQIIGGVVWGLGMALHEETMMDYGLGRFMNHNLGEYHIPAHADIQDIDVIFVDEPDPEVSPLGIKGVGEIGVVGTAAAIANAIFHATGRRVRDLPITIDKLL
jgi:xanthine dehydrogenase YagR molybdenum-binding subunit